MNAVNKSLRSLILVLAMAAPRAGVAEDAAAIIVDRLRQSCPIAEPGKEQAAYETCRAALFADERLHALFSPALRWGGDVPGKSLAELELTHFDPRVLSGLYLSLFETTGRVSTASDATGHIRRSACRSAFATGSAPDNSLIRSGIRQRNGRPMRMPIRSSSTSTATVA
jgi:hypothetical protein